MRVAGVRAEHLWTNEGWRSPAYLELDARGRIVRIHDDADAPGALRLDGFVIPGLPNLHSHAFQRALAGRAERWSAGDDDFWSWRTEMYRLAEHVTPDQHEAIAAALYVEMLEAGFTSVAEFHYLHHDRDGRPYADRAEMSRRILSAASASGIDVLLLPVLYLRGGFGRPASPSQRRFLSKDADELVALASGLSRDAEAIGARVGIAPHSLRAVDEVSLARAAELWSGPIHLHIAEQTLEVEQCLAALGARPVAWLLDRLSVDARWTLVHATHLDDAERHRLARSGAVAGLCPSTEANLGDGIFPARAYLAEGGVFGVGSDSHASISATEELRLLEYGQRLTHRRRNLLGDAARPSVAERLWSGAVSGGARALALERPGIQVGARADLVALDAAHPRLAGHGVEAVMDAFVFGGADAAIKDVVAGGVHVVRGGRHVRREEARAGLARALAELRAQS